MLFGADLIKSLEKENEMLRNSIDDRRRRIDDGWTDMEDCFISQRVEERGIRNNNDKIALIKRGGLHWFRELATADGIPVESHWVDTRYGMTRRVQMPDGSVVWTSADTDKGLARKGLKKVTCLRPAWYAFHSSQRGMCGVYSGDYVLFPSDVNYATGEDASCDPIEMKDGWEN